MTYQEYKESNIAWIGKIPIHWEVHRLKNLCSLKARIGWKGLRSEEFEEESYAYLVTGQDFKRADIDWDSCYQINKERYDEDPYIQLNNGDLLITKDGTIGKIAKVSNLDKPACLNSGVFVLKQKADKFDQGYLYWSLVSNLLGDFNNYTSTGTTILHLYQNVFENMPLVLPPIEEQVKIALYLDKKCDKINSAIDTQKKKIELLNELKQTIITNAVTKGLNPEAQMKDSGVAWIGEVPNHWEVCKTLHCLSQPITDGPHETPELFPEGIPFVSAEAVSCGNGSIDFNHIRGFISEEYYRECCKKYTPQKDDVYMIKSGATTGKVAMVDTDIKFTIWSPLAVFRCNQQKMLPKFLFHSLTCPFYQVQVELGWNYGTQQNIGMRTLEKLYLIVPPINEQHDILSYLDEKLADVNSQISKTFRRIELLQELKQSIITEAVTGKIKVC